MKIGIALPTMVPGLDRDTLLAWMRAVDDGPFSLLACGERIAYPNQEMMSVLAAAAAVTERVELMASVSVTPMHAPAHVAKQAATIDVISNGRFVLGVGVGGRDEDYRAMGAPFERRHPRLDEQIAAIKALWAGEAAIEGVGPVGPPPVCPGGPTILSGSMGPKGMARAAKWADGLAGFDMAASPDAIGAANVAFTNVWKEAGRAGTPYLQSSGWFALTADAEQSVKDYAFSYLRIFGDEVATMLADLQTLTSPAAIRDALHALADTGLDEFILVGTQADPDEVKRAADVVASL